MKPKVLVVEDNKDLLFGIETLLEINDFDVVTALDGKKALEYLKKEKKLPDIILSDIMMPHMDGYDFFKEVIADNRLNFIPFVFLTAKSTSDDIREGKLLGVDDYLTKPFKEKDLLATIRGKINRSKHSKKMAKKIEEGIFESLKIKKEPELKKDDSQKVELLLVIWDEVWGPELKLHHSKRSETELINIAVQLFNVTTAIYGKDKLRSSEDVLLKIKSLGKYGYLYFDYIEDEEVRTGQRQFMLAVLAPNISYVKSREIKQYLKTIAVKIKSTGNAEDIDAVGYWMKIVECLTNPTFATIIKKRNNQ